MSKLCHWHQRIFIRQFSNFDTAELEFTPLHIVKFCASLVIFLGDIEGNKSGCFLLKHFV